MDPVSTAGRVLQEGHRPIIKDNYEQRLDYFAQTMSGQDRDFQAQVINEIHRQDPGAYDSWLTAERMNTLVDQGQITPQERDDLYAGFAYGLENGTIPADAVPGQFVGDSNSVPLASAYIARQDLNSREGFDNAVMAFSTIPADQMAAYINDPANAQTMQAFELAVQQHQDWYENLTMDTVVTGPYSYQEIEGKVTFSQEQLQAMRDGFRTDDNLLTNGELLLAYPDRAERNEQVTQQYYELSTAMSGIVGTDNANWATFASWASDEIGRNLTGNVGIGLGETAGGNPRFWLSKGNSMLISDIGPAFQYFTETFANGQNRDMSFEQFWSNFSQSHQGRNISYLDGGGDAEHDMQNAFKAYYESMQLHDRELTTTNPTERQALAERRSDLMLYGNTLVGLQEQEIVDGDINAGMSTVLGVNTGGMGGAFIDFHLPGANGQGERRIDTDLDIPLSQQRADPAGTQFTTVDGQTINLDQALRDRLNGLDDVDNDGDEFDINNSGTNHWESYGERMGAIYHLFANFQRDPALFNNPRDVFDSRATPLNNDPRFPNPIVIPSAY